MADIEARLMLNKRKLISFALLSGCDYNQHGVYRVGPERIKSLFNEMETHCQDILDRLCGWKDCPELQKLGRRRDSLNKMQKPLHCSRCEHAGSLSTHQCKGCEQCTTRGGCQPNTGAPCTCKWHRTTDLVNSHAVELKVREKAMSMDHFTEHCKEIVDEFTSMDDEKETMLSTEVVKRMPDLRKVCLFLNRSINTDKVKAVSKLLPIFAHMHLHFKFEWQGFRPISVVKKCQRKLVSCYETIWSKLVDDVWTDVRTYTIDVEQSLFDNRYPDIVDSFTRLEELSRCVTPKGQVSIKDMLSSPKAPRKKFQNRQKPSAEQTPTSGRVYTLERNPQKWKKRLNFSDEKVAVISACESDMDDLGCERIVWSDDEHDSSLTFGKHPRTPQTKSKKAPTTKCSESKKYSDGDSASANIDESVTSPQGASCGDSSQGNNSPSPSSSHKVMEVVDSDDDGVVTPTRLNSPHADLKMPLRKRKLLPRRGDNPNSLMSYFSVIKKNK